MARGILILVTAAAFVALLMLSFELGRNRAGFSLLDERRERAAFEQEIAARDQVIDELEREIAILETSSQIDNEANALVRESLADLEARLQAQEEELAFYRGIVSPGDGIAGLRIQNVEIEPAQTGEGYTLRVLLVQAIVNSNSVAGEIRATLRGNQSGQAMAYTLSELSSETGSGAIDFDFRYFQSLDVELILPAGFEPVELEVEVWPQNPQGETIVQTFPWNSFEG